MAFCSRPVFLFFILFLQWEASAERITPVLLWSPERSMSSLPDVGDVDSVRPDAFLKDYLAPLMQHSAESAVVFLQNKLHVDDFTKFADVYSLDSDGGAFKNIKSFMEDHFSLEIPQVENPLEAIEKLKSSFEGSVHTASSPAEVEKLDLSPDQRFLLVVELAPPAEMKDEEQIIASNDASVGAICHHLQKRGIKYTAMFTGKSASENKRSSGVDTFSGRHLLATADANNGTFMNVSGIFVFLRDVQLHLQTTGGEKLDLNFTANQNSADNSKSGNGTAIVQLDFQGSSENGTGFAVKVVFNITNGGDRWTINTVRLTVDGPAGPGFNGTLDNSPLRTGDMDLVVPILYSYHCSSMKMYVDYIRDKSLASYAGSYVVLNGLQMQPFNVQGNAFFNAQDCVGFFTRGIWMGIFSSLILVAILIFGTMMTLGLSTPDRFDDPKGKTIVIAQAED